MKNKLHFQIDDQGNKLPNLVCTDVILTHLPIKCHLFFTMKHAFDINLSICALHAYQVLKKIQLKFSWRHNPNVSALQDGKLTKEEVYKRHEVFSGSQVTDFGDVLMYHDEF